MQEALIKALQQWPYRGVPENPLAWLIQVAKNRALDLLRREASLREKSDEIVRAFAAQEEFANRRIETERSAELIDDTLGMIFMACHPAIPREGRVALTLKTVGGFGVSEIARAFLAKEPTVAQRLVRAKRLIRDEGVTFDLPGEAEMSNAARFRSRSLVPALQRGLHGACGREPGSRRPGSRSDQVVFAARPASGDQSSEMPGAAGADDVSGGPIARARGRRGRIGSAFRAGSLSVGPADDLPGI